jgi:hypothetical protein
MTGRCGVIKLIFFLVTTGMLSACGLQNVPQANTQMTVVIPTEKSTIMGTPQSTENPIPPQEGISPAVTQIISDTQIPAGNDVNTPLPTTTPLSNVTTENPGHQNVSSEEPMYVLQSGTPAWLPNLYAPEAGCNWLGIGGQVFDNEGQAKPTLVVEVSGTFEGMNVDDLSLTGIAPAYGPGGYEIILADHVAASYGTLKIQLKDLLGNQLSEMIPFNTYSDCNKNLILINFVRAGSTSEQSYYIPLLIVNPAATETNTP